MITYDGWDREYAEHKAQYLNLFDAFMSQAVYENAEFFEKTLASKVGRQFAVSVGSATDALYFSLLAHNIGPADEDLVTNFSWISSASCITMAGATPVFCDIDLDSYHISLASIKKMYSSRTKAIIYTPLFGNMTDVSSILEFCADKGIVFIEDSAQAIGSSLNGTLAGSIGDCSVFSFNTNKVVAGINGGGIFVTNNPEKADLVRKIRRHGKVTDFEMLGFNSRLYTFNAQIIDLRLQHASSTQNKRQCIAAKYEAALNEFPVYTQKMLPGLNHNYHKYVVRFTSKASRDAVKDRLRLSVHYDTPLSSNSMYNNIDHRKDECINSEIAASTVLSLPIHAWLTDEETTSIIQHIKDVL